MTIFKTLAVAAATIIAAPAAMALTIDLFDDADPGQTVAADGGGIVPHGSEVFNDSVIGDYRDLWVETTPDNTFLGTTLSVQNGTLSFNNSSGQTGFGEVVYDGMDGDPTGADQVNTTGLGGIDLTFGITNPGFFFEVIASDGIFDFTATVWDMLGNTHTYVENVAGLAFNPFLPLTEFTSNGVDVTNVGAIAFTVESAGTVSIDGSLGSITVIPLPASALLLLGGLGGLFGAAAVGRRRRQAV